MKTPSLKNLFLGTQDDQLPAIYSSEENLSYGELKDRVDKTVRTFIDLDIAENDHIAILGNNEPEFISIVIALWHLGAVPVPLNTRLLNKELNELILRSDCKAILV
ncbi:MAG TPA: AMP-binding protein, partial [Ignavibacteriaceae bacterium]|nr:AMP-binding protein [Ignavibacteriaceae bacterium]